jgi:acetylornithine deacetylase/succinyl-diaminopimelate desuccinylase-like protein
MTATGISEAGLVRTVTRLAELGTSTPAGVLRAMQYAGSLLAGSQIKVTRHNSDLGPVLSAQVGPATGPLIVWLAGLDVAQASGSVRYMADEPGRRLVGSGIFDLGVAACMLHALPLVAQNQARVSLVLVGDTAQPPPHSITEYASTLGQKPDFCIAGGPTQLKVATEAMGVIVVRGTIRRGEGPCDEAVSNPILEGHYLFELIKRLPFMRMAAAEFSRPSALALTHLRGGSPLDVTEDCDLRFIVHFPLGLSPEDVRREIEQALRQRADELRSYGEPFVFQLDVGPPVPPVRVEPDDPYVSALVDAVRLRPHQDPAAVLTVQQEASDLALAGWLGVQFGPSGGDRRRSSEWLNVGSLVRCTRALVEFAEQAGALARRL